MPAAPSPTSRLRVVRLPGITDARRGVESAMLARGIAMPLSARVEWLEAFPSAQSELFVVQDGTGAPVGGIVVEESRSAALPGHRIWRVRQLDPTAPHDVIGASLDAVVQAARSNWRVLRLHVDVFAREPASRAAITALMRGRGLTRLASPREHEWTLAIDLSHGAESVWNSLSSVRRNVRQVLRGPFEVRVVSDDSFVDRMDTLLEATFARTGGVAERVDFAGVIKLGTLLPAASRIVGLFHTGITGPESLVAFAWAVRNGSHACYLVGATTRAPEVKRYPLAYSPQWALIDWAAAEGAAWYDLGGVTRGSSSSGDPLGGISDFKRHFSREMVEVREEWQLEPHPWRARLARAMSEGAATVKRARSRLRDFKATQASQPVAEPTPEPVASEQP